MLSLPSPFRATLALLATAGVLMASEGADVVLRGGLVYTVDPGRRRAEALAVDGGRIVFVGSRDGVARFVGARTRVFDLSGRMVLPGFQDSHAHPVTSGHDLVSTCALNGVTSVRELEERVVAYAREHPARTWVSGSGWALSLFPDGAPRKERLDALVADRPAYLEAEDGHSGWVNSRALAAAGIGRDTPDPPGGRIERDPVTREPTGTLRESAVEAIYELLPPVTPEELARGLRRWQEEASRLGITSVQDADVSDEVLAAYLRAAADGSLRARVTCSLSVEQAKGLGELGRLERARARCRSPLVQATAVKLFVDGVIESRTAALLEPYAGGSGDRGEPLWTPEELDRMVVGLDRRGFQVHFHAIGDRAVRMALDACAAARAANGVRDSRHHVAHLELVHPLDVSRFRELGVVADFEAFWAWRDPYVEKLTEPALGPERSSRLYPIGSLARAGAFLVGGSDWSVTSMNPLEAIQVAVTRRGVGQGPGAPWLPAEAVGLERWLAACTINGARLAGRERETGSLEVGKAADVVVLDRDLFALPPDQLHEAKVLLTLFAGREAYRDPALAPTRKAPGPTRPGAPPGP